LGTPQAADVPALQIEKADQETRVEIGEIGNENGYF
jgi:hypothetical protein